MAKARTGRTRGKPPTGLRKWWSWIREQWLSVADLRFNFMLLAAGVLLVCVVTPGRDVVATISDSWALGSFGTRHWWLFVVAVALLGMQVWLWSRLLIQLRHRDRPDWRKNKLLVHLPRLLGIVPYLAAAVALATVPEGVSTGYQAAFLLFLGVVAYAFYWIRYRVFARMFSWRLARVLFQDPAGPIGLTRFEVWTLALSLALSVAILAWLSFDPVTLPMGIGSAALAFLAFALVIPPVNLLLAAVWRDRFPMLTALLLLALGASFLNDNHEIRTVEAPLRTRQTLEQAYVRWVAQAPRDRGNPSSVTAVLAAGAGGASRAGLWTLAALQRVDEEDRDFNRRIFAISAVSGSAMGAIDYVASIAADARDDPQARRRLAWGHAGADFLAPALGGMLYTDLVQRFIPFPLFNDRSWSIERGFEAAWSEACENERLPATCQGLMRGPFLDLWDGRRATWRPNLLLIGTVEEDGSRIVTSNIDLFDHRLGRPWLPAVYDYFRVGGRQVAASTAIMNSARFPWISPAGRIASPSPDDPARSIDRAHLIDGGYFETSGADTSEDLAEALVRLQRRLCPAPSPQCPALRIVFLTLLNGEVEVAAPRPTPGRSQPLPALKVDAGRSIPVERSSPSWRGRLFANDLFGPLYGLFGVQSSRGERTLTRMARGEAGVPAAEVRLLPCRNEHERPLAMSWALSELTRNRMQRQLASLRLQPIPAPQPSICGALLQRKMSDLAVALGIGMPSETAPPGPPRAGRQVLP